ncbi:hypothetical protein LA080_013770 [Diaporthe eres]|uniref:F-box domain-containing protein n=1 Tax=Diaporthe vaccinii TaxID=105482 RepID=A0ABR4ETQ1_9PEZI|nr:hypothetical protein LA080_013770 [Diaporthe eres]
MASTSQAIVKPPNWLDGSRIPAEIKLIILENITSHHDLLSLIKVYPEWVLELWKTYPKQLFPRAWINVFNEIDEDLIPELNWVYHIRKIRKNYEEFMWPCRETQWHRDQLQDALRALLSTDDIKFPAVEASLDSVLDLGKIVRDVYSLTFRYSNDAWKRIHHIAEETGTGSVSSTGHTTPPAIQLTVSERFKFARAFFRVEIYLLTKYWTNLEGERHILNMGTDILEFIPHSRDDEERGEFDSCLRYMFHAYRRLLKMTAKELGAPELPTRDDLPWVRTMEEDYSGEYQFKDYPTMKTDNPIFKFAQRSISEEQCFLLWLCEYGIATLEKIHQVERTVRRDDFIRCFSEQRHSWETVKLRHRLFRYDSCVEEPLSRLHSWTGSSENNMERNRHPVMSLYGRGRHTRYADVPSKWACASAFLNWSAKEPASGWFIERGDITLNMHGRWITLSDTDSGAYRWKPFCLKDKIHGGVPHGHTYMLTHEKYEFRSLPKQVFLIQPR